MTALLTRSLQKTLVFVKFGRNLLVEEKKNIPGNLAMLLYGTARVRPIQPVSLDHAGT